MEVIRFNPFRQVHKGLRALLFETGILLQHNDFSSEEEVNSAVKAVRLVLYLFHGHANIEDTKVFPVIAPQAPEIVAAFEAEHEKDSALSSELETCCERLLQAASVESRSRAGQQLLHQYNEFVAFNLSHMNREETTINEILWRYFTDQELQQMVAEVGRTTPPEENRHFMFWMLKGNSKKELVAWLQGVKATAPAEVYDGLYALAQATLSKERWAGIAPFLIHTSQLS